MMLFVPLLVAVPPNNAVRAEDKPITSTIKGELYADFVAEAAQRFELPAAWIHAVVRTEAAAIRARFHRRARSG